MQKKKKNKKQLIKKYKISYEITIRWNTLRGPLKILK